MTRRLLAAAALVAGLAAAPSVSGVPDEVLCHAVDHPLQGNVVLRFCV